MVDTPQRQGIVNTSRERQRQEGDISIMANCKAERILITQ